MGFPLGFAAKANASSSECPYGSFPFYVWIADGIGHELWNLMDTRFDYWHNRTGESLAFFVDPFQREEWARELLSKYGYDQKLIDEILLTRGTYSRILQRKTLYEYSSPFSHR